MSKLCVTINSHLRLKVKKVIISYVINQLFARNQTIKVNSKIQRISYKSQTKVIKELYKKVNIVFVFLITLSIFISLFYLNLHLTKTHIVVYTSMVCVNNTFLCFCFLDSSVRYFVYFFKHFYDFMFTWCGVSPFLCT